MTKEAKLSAAMRIVPEWRLYDEEVRALQARVRRGLYQHADSEQVRLIRFSYRVAGRGWWGRGLWGRVRCVRGWWGR